MSYRLLILAVIGWSHSIVSYAHDFEALDWAAPREGSVESIAPIFDFDGDGCLPSAGISRSGQQNGGLKPSGSLGGGCRPSDFLRTSNTMHRSACVTEQGVVFCGHFFALYFLKDQILKGVQSGHRHDWEHAAIWTRNGIVTHGSASAHGKLLTLSAAEIPFENGHMKIVYHKDGIGTHALRFASRDEQAENPYGRFVLPNLASWYEMTGDTIDNAGLRDRLSSFDYGSANFPLKDSSFFSGLNNFRPSDYPAFSF